MFITVCTVNADYPYQQDAQLAAMTNRMLNTVAMNSSYDDTSSFSSIGQQRIKSANESVEEGNNY